jgi:hypothetical protein
MVTRPVIASIASTIRAICRTVVIFISVVRQRSNGRIESMVFVVLSLSGFDYQRYHKNHACFPASFGEGIDYSAFFPRVSAGVYCVSWHMQSLMFHLPDQTSATVLRYH